MKAIVTKINGKLQLKEISETSKPNATEIDDFDVGYNPVSDKYNVIGIHNGVQVADIVADDFENKVPLMF